MQQNGFYKIEKIRQTDKEDIFKITRKKTGEVFYDKYPRTMELTEKDLIEDHYMEDNE